MCTKVPEEMNGIFLAMRRGKYNTYLVKVSEDEMRTRMTVIRMCQWLQQGLNIPKQVYTHTWVFVRLKAKEDLGTNSVFLRFRAGEWS